MSSPAFDLYDAGRISEALSRLKEESGNPAAQALVALTENHPIDVLSTTLDSSDVLAWYLRAIAAFRVGDAKELRAAVSRALEIASEDEAEELHEFQAFVEVANASRDGRMRVAGFGAPVPAVFDPSLSHVVCDMEVNGTVLKMVVDTGAEMTILDRAVSERIGVRSPSNDTVTAGTNTGEVSMAMGLVDDFRWLGISWRDVPVLSVDLSHRKAELGCDGVLGVQDLLSDVVLKLDYQEGSIIRHSKSRHEGWPMYFTQGRALISVEGRMNGGADGLFRIDTGGAQSVLTKEYLAAALEQGAVWDVSEEQTEVRKIVTEQTRKRRYVKELHFQPANSAGALSLLDVPVDTTMADDLIAYGGKLGADAFKCRVLELDYPACHLRLSPLD